MTAALVTFLAGAGIACADGGPGGAACVPTVPLAPVKVYRRPQPPPPGEAPTLPLPAPTVFRKEVAPPEWTEAPPSPPVRLLQGTPPPVLLVRGEPPPVKLLRRSAPPPLWVDAKPMPTVTLFRRQVQPVQEADTLVIPPIKLFHKAPPCGPECTQRSDSCTNGILRPGGVVIKSHQP